MQDRDGAKMALEKVKHRLRRLRLIWVDGGYAGQLVAWAERVCSWVLEIIQRPSSESGFVVLPRRWVVEHTFAWLGMYRRLSKDYEALAETSEAFIYAAMVHVMVSHLAVSTLAARNGIFRHTHSIRNKGRCRSPAADVPSRVKPKVVRMGITTIGMFVQRSRRLAWCCGSFWLTV